MNRIFVLRDQSIINNCILYIKENAMISKLNGKPLVIKISEEKITRSIEANALMWSRLGDISKQVDWYGEYLSDHDWKNIFTACLRKQKIVPGIEGGVVVLGMSTSKMSKQEHNDLLELINAFGAEKNVSWTISK